LDRKCLTSIHQWRCEGYASNVTSIMFILRFAILYIFYISGLGTVQHYPEIMEKDRKKLYTSGVRCWTFD
jgi:hypothetical protein